MTSLADAYIRLRYDSTGLDRDLSRVKHTVVSQIAGIATMGAGVLAGLGFHEAITGLRGVAMGFINANAKMEGYRTSLTILLGDQKRALRLLGELEQFSKTTPFQIDTLMGATQLLKSYGFEVEGLLPKLRAIGDAAAAMPMGMEQGMYRISLALGQMKAKGKVMGMEMIQLANAGIPAWQILADKAGVSIAQVQKMAQSGAISGNQAIEMLISGFRDRFEGMMDAQSKKFVGLMSTVKDLGDIFRREVGEPFFEFSKLKLTGIKEFLESPDADRWAKSLRRQTEAWVEFAGEVQSNVVSAVMSEQAQSLFLVVKRIGAVVLGYKAGAMAVRMFIGIATGLAGVLTAINIPMLAVVATLGSLAYIIASLHPQTKALTQELSGMVNAALGIDKVAAALHASAKEDSGGALIDEVMRRREAWAEEAKQAEKKNVPVHDILGRRVRSDRLSPLESELATTGQTAAGDTRLKAQTVGKEISRAMSEMESYQQGIASAIRLVRTEEEKLSKAVEGFQTRDQIKHAEQQVELAKEHERLMGEKIHKQDMLLTRLREEITLLQKRAREESSAAQQTHVDELVKTMGGRFSEAGKQLLGGLQFNPSRNPASGEMGLINFGPTEGQKESGAHSMGRVLSGIFGPLAQTLKSGVGGFGGLGMAAARGATITEGRVTELSRMTGASEEQIKAEIEKTKREREKSELMEKLGISGLPQAEKVQFSAIDQFAKQIQTALSEDSDRRIAEETKEAAEKTVDGVKEAVSELTQINRKLPVAVGFA